MVPDDEENSAFRKIQRNNTIKLHGHGVLGDGFIPRQTSCLLPAQGGLCRPFQGHVFRVTHFHLGNNVWNRTGHLFAVGHTQVVKVFARFVDKSDFVVLISNTRLSKA